MILTLLKKKPCRKIRTFSYTAVPHFTQGIRSWKSLHKTKIVFPINLKVNITDAFYLVLINIINPCLNPTPSINNS